MQRLPIYPRSFLKLILLGLSLLALPLLAGLLYGAYALDRLAKDSALTVHRAALIAHASRSLGEEVTTMERGAGQAAILGDQVLWRGYLAARARFRQALDELSALSWTGEERELLATLATLEAGLDDRLPTIRSGGKVARQRDARFDALAAAVRRFDEAAHRSIEREAAALRADAEVTRRSVAWLLSGLVPLIALLLGLLSMMIARPVRQIDLAIRRLRDGGLHEPVRVDGPRDLQYLGERLDWLRQGLLQADADKRRILRHLSHELKTPLAALCESAALLRDGTVGPLSPAQTEIAGILGQNLQRLRVLIEQLLDYRALLADRTPPALQPVQVRELLERVIEGHRPALLAKGITVELACEAHEARTDAEHLRVIVDNLLSNAIRHSPRQGVIDLRVAFEAAATVIEIDDQGPGVSERDLPRIFEAFYQGAPAPDAPLRGSGLGLSIVQELVSGLGGHVAAMRAPGGGARFRVRLPV